MVRDLPEHFSQLRSHVLSHSSYLTHLPKNELGKAPSEKTFKHILETVSDTEKHGLKSLTQSISSVIPTAKNASNLTNQTCKRDLIT